MRACLPYLDKLLSTKVMPRGVVILLQLFFHDGLRRDTGVVDARNVQGSMAQHSVPPEINDTRKSSNAERCHRRN